MEVQLLKVVRVIMRLGRRMLLAVKPQIMIDGLRLCDLNREGPELDGDTGKGVAAAAAATIAVSTAGSLTRGETLWPASWLRRGRMEGDTRRWWFIAIEVGFDVLVIAAHDR